MPHQWGHSSAGRAPAWHAGGQRFESAWLHSIRLLVPQGVCLVARAVAGGGASGAERGKIKCKNEAGDDSPPGSSYQLAPGACCAWMSMRGYRDNSRPRRNYSAINRVRLDWIQIKSASKKGFLEKLFAWASSMRSSTALGWCVSQLLHVTVDPVFLCAPGSWCAVLQMRCESFDGCLARSLC